MPAIKTSGTEQIYKLCGAQLSVLVRSYTLTPVQIVLPYR